MWTEADTSHPYPIDGVIPDISSVEMGLEMDLLEEGAKELSEIAENSERK